MTQIDREIHHILGLEESTLSKWPHYPKQSQCNAISIKLPMVFFTDLEQKKLQFVWKYKRHQIPKAILRGENGAGGIRLLTSDYTTKLQ